MDIILDINNMSQREKDLLRSSVLLDNIKLYIRYNGKCCNFPKGVDIPVYSRAAKKTGLKYPYPKWVACDFYIHDEDGDIYPIANKIHGKLSSGFTWVIK